MKPGYRVATVSVLTAVFLVLLVHGFSSAGTESSDSLDALKKVMKDDLKVKIKHETKLKEGTETVPPMQSDSWQFNTGVSAPMVRYTRFLNRPPHFNGKYPSLAGHDMGIGFDGGSFGNWYRGNVLRLLVNDRDIFAAAPTDLIETEEGSNGHLSFIWELEKEGRVSLNITVPEDGHAVFARLDLSLPGIDVNSVQVRLNCYPGGYGPACKLPSHRWAFTAGQSSDVPNDFKASADNPYPVLPVTVDNDWVFYADKLQSKGSLALLLNRQEGANGVVRMSNYCQVTVLDYPVESRRIHLGFYAFDIENEAAAKLFASSLDKEREVLESIPFLPYR